MLRLERARVMDFLEVERSTELVTELLVRSPEDAFRTNPPHLLSDGAPRGLAGGVVDPVDVDPVEAVPDATGFDVRLGFFGIVSGFCSGSGFFGLSSGVWG